LFDEVLVLELEAYLRRPGRLVDFLSALRARRFDVVVDFDQWMRLTALLTLATGAPYRFGFDTRNQHRRFCYTRSVRPPKDRHEVDNFLDLAELTGAPRGDRRLQMWIPDQDAAWARRTLGSEQETSIRPVAFHPGCGGAGKPREWPPEFYVELANRLTRHCASLTIALTGSPGESPLVERIASRLERRCLRLAGAHSVTRFAALLRESRLLVSGNTGAMHIAAAVGTPVVALHGPTNPNKWGPVGERHTVLQSPIACSPCLDLGFDYGCTTHPCMRMIAVNQVYRAALGLLGMEQLNG
jgi:ADP-heptose:LPS heptosyltransferase